MRSRTKTPIAFQALGALEPPRDTPARWYLRVEHGSAVGGPTADVPAAGLRFGRDPEPGEQALLVLNDPDVSRNHALVVKRGSGLAIEDLQSTNGTTVNGRRVLKAELRAGDVIRAGGTVLVVGYGDPNAAIDAAHGLIGRTLALRQLRRTVELAAPSTLPVLIIGATGTGKELVAKALHDASGRRGELVAVNAGAMPGTLVEDALFGHRRGAFTDARADEPGAFARANGGTLFLDEIGEMALDAQPKLLRALETGEITPIGASRPVQVDVRIVAATNRPLLDAVDAGRFRDDLYARLAGVVVEMPLLSSRREDVLLLFRHFLPPGAHSVEMSANFAEALLRYDWPRNVRELRRVAERLPVLHPDARRWEFGMLDETIRRAVTASAAKPEAPAAAGVEWPPTREGLVALLDRCDGNVSKLAEMVGRNRKQVYRWMDKLGVNAGTGRE